jgi:NAD(P)-dependent dehydrogenase (short-subunit alcohol dehydrogenase family)
VWQEIEKNMLEYPLPDPPPLRGGGRRVANAAVLLASPRASFITRVNLVVDGALTNRVQY